MGESREENAPSSDSNFLPIYSGLLTTHYFLLLLLLSTFFPDARNGLCLRETRSLSKAVNFADAVCTKTEHFPRGYGFLANQVNRASLSIAANIAEGNGRFTKQDRKNFFGIARGSVQECVPLLELAARRGLIEAEDHKRLKVQLEEFAKTLAGLIRSLENRSSPPAIRGVDGRK